MEAGPCNGTFERWYYDKETDACHPFYFGGCKGNKNNYPTEASCGYHCKKPGVHKRKYPARAGGVRVCYFLFQTVASACQHGPQMLSITCSVTPRVLAASRIAIGCDDAFSIFLSVLFCSIHPCSGFGSFDCDLKRARVRALNSP